MMILGKIVHALVHDKPIPDIPFKDLLYVVRKDHEADLIFMLQVRMLEARTLQGGTELHDTYSRTLFDLKSGATWPEDDSRDYVLKKACLDVLKAKVKSVLKGDYS